ncbi:transcription termination factor MTERF9, chloroplastic [Mercurialis annua]|uniref:transcription termination factor MTERF9, chloroplastic n=1 Tax=Mercurialis annua TaxID=3986 RepID=UPI00215FA60F|nr:transcription termination factor MTERF9, chloroplastic [Mercurialis annua]
MTTLSKSKNLSETLKIDMIPNPNSVTKFISLIITSQRFLLLQKNPVKKSPLFFITTKHATCSTICQAELENGINGGTEQPKNSIDVLKKWGCNENDLQKILSRRPSLRNADLTHLQSKLFLLKSLGIKSDDLVKIINCRPRFLSCRINNCFDERLEYFMTLFGSKEVLVKAIVRNPSLLTYDFHNSIKPAIALYERMGVCKKDLIPMLLSRPTLIPRTSFDDQKTEYIRKTGVSKESKMYKYVVTLIGISKNETIREKVANFEKFGFSDEEVWGFFGRSPLFLTLSVDKVQRNMTFIVGTMKLPANVVLQCPYLLYNNLEVVLKPRMLTIWKIQDMNLCPQIKAPMIVRAMRMTEKRFFKVFVLCHPKDVAQELMNFYKEAKGCKRLAESSKKIVNKGFPF